MDHIPNISQAGQEKLRQINEIARGVDVHAQKVNLEEMRKRFGCDFADDYERISREIEAFKSKWPRIYKKDS